MSPSAATMGMIHESPKKTTLEKKESIEKERQISVDPISMQTKTEAEVTLHHLLPPPGKFVSCSLPNSPRFESSSAKHKKKHKNQPSPLTRQQSVALGNLERLRMQRSKSCGEGRVCQPSIDLDLWPSADNEGEEAKTRGGNGNGNGNGDGGRGKSKGEDKFKCGACLFLPGLGKGKTVRARKEVEEEHADIVSQRVSLEKFECGSWRSSAIINCQDDGDSTSNLFFDLPLELMRCASVNDAESPVTTGFLFDANRKGVPKIGKSHESRHVRFSTSSPTSPSPRLRNQRDDDFTAFLEAQSA